MKRQTIDYWLANHVAVKGENDCWVATGGGYNKKGWHVSFKANGGRHMAHRAAYERAYGPITDGKFVLHRCDVPQCCNPKHLFLGTQSENAKDMWSKGRGNPIGVPLGTVFGPSPRRKVTREAFSTAVDKYLLGGTQREVAREIGITDVAFGFILRGKTYPEFSDIAQRAQHLLGRGNKNRRSNNANSHD